MLVTSLAIADETTEPKSQKAKPHARKHTNLNPRPNSLPISLAQVDSLGRQRASVEAPARRQPTAAVAPRRGSEAPRPLPRSRPGTVRQARRSERDRLKSGRWLRGGHGVLVRSVPELHERHRLDRADQAFEHCRFEARRAQIATSSCSPLALAWCRFEPEGNFACGREVSEVNP